MPSTSGRAAGARDAQTLQAMLDAMLAWMQRGGAVAAGTA